MGSTHTSTYCDECGPAQANHFALWFDGLNDALFFWMSGRTIPFYRFLTKIAEGIIYILGQMAFIVGKTFRLVTLSYDPETAVSNRSKLLWLEAQRRGFDMSQVLFLGRPTDTFYLRRTGAPNQFFTSLPLSPHPDALRMDDKILFKKAMVRGGLPVPKSRGVATLKGARKVFSELECVCVKPRTGSNGRHTYPYVRTEAEFTAAFKSVKKISPFASIEEHIEGNLCRATCVGGTLIGFLESSYPWVTGDGTATIRELVARMNAQKLAGVEDLVLDAAYTGYIRRRGYEVEDVLPAGTRLQLSYRGGRSAGSTNREHGRTIHPSFIEPIEAAARLTKLHIVGFDIIVPDAFSEAGSQRWGFIEANSLPWIDLHATPYYGEPIDLSVAVWDLWETQNSTAC